MKDLEHLFENNARWAESIKDEDPAFFEKLAQQQVQRLGHLRTRLAS